MAYVAPTWVNESTPAINAARLNLLSNAAEANQHYIITNYTISAGSWAADTTYASYPYRATITFAGVTSDYVPTVVFEPDIAVSGIVAPVCETTTDGVYVYAATAPASDITVLSVMVEKPTGNQPGTNNGVDGGLGTI